MLANTRSRHLLKPLSDQSSRNKNQKWLHLFSTLKRKSLSLYSQALLFFLYILCLLKLLTQKRFKSS
ncbi:Uncharacterized protein TCM_030522 [Theobroma cacao]|uniref:Uncharacterized protein n=1 Tax=Theobroma cacao TaxID=3641 RepID=A0A061F487_THECC|nr:Uncharacterized protein TCM_030522 [Theobroma cacao]